MARKWAKFPHPDKAYSYDGAELKKHWARLHRGDCESFPKDPVVQEAWRLYHRGDFQAAVATGNATGGAAIVPAAKAQAIYASYLEKSAGTKLELFKEAAEWADRRRSEAAKDVNAHYVYAYALGRYSQGISVAKALAQGFGGKIRDALLAVLKLAPAHAEAHSAWGAYQAEVINKVGALVGNLTYGVKKDNAVEHFQKAITLNPTSAIARIEYANGLLLLFGNDRIADAEKLYREAAGATPVDAMERLDVQFAKSELK